MKGAEVEIRLFSAVNGSKIHRGILKGYSEGDVIAEENGEDTVFPKAASPRCRPYLNGKRRISEKQKITTKITKGKIYTRYKSQQVKPDECRIL